MQFRFCHSLCYCYSHIGVNLCVDVFQGGNIFLHYRWKSVRNWHLRFTRNTVTKHVYFPCLNFLLIFILHVEDVFESFGFVAIACSECNFWMAYITTIIMMHCNKILNVKYSKVLDVQRCPYYCARSRYLIVLALGVLQSRYCHYVQTAILK